MQPVNAVPCVDPDPPALESADSLYRASLRDVHARTDRLFAVLMACQFVAGVVIAAVVSPRAWRGTAHALHPHVWAAVVVGFGLASAPIALALRRPGRTVTRMTIAVAQILFGVLLIHLTGGRIETHFHVFGSLAFLALYRDWRVLAVATAVTAADHVLRGAYLPLTIYGTASASPWRWAEHTAWVVFEDVILVIGCVRGTREMRGIADRTAALARSEAHARAVLDTTLDAVVQFDAAGTVTGWNSQAERTFGWTAGEAVGRKVSETVVAPVRRAAHDAEREAFLATGRWDVVDQRMVRPSIHRCGHQFPTEVSIRPLRDGDGRFTFAAFLRDISPRLAVEAELRAAKEAAEAASVSKSAFLANMSHEIRTPMTAIIGFGDVLADPDRTPSERADAVAAVRRNGRHLLQLVNDILDVSKIEAGQMAVERLPVELTRLVADVVDLTRPRAVEAGLRFAVRYDGPVPRTIRTDALRVRQVLTNLLGNATKFTTPGGSVSLTVSARATAAGDAVRFDVADTGCGITPGQAERLFRPFTQADESTTRKYGGTGLGLTISRRLARLLGGDVTVTSTAGVGSTFTATVDAGDLTGVEPVAGPDAHAADPVAPPPAPLPRLDGRRVLLADDGFDNQMLIGLYLRTAGAVVTTVDNGRRAVDAAVAARDQGRPFDLVVTDMQMPELDGYAATAELRRLGFTAVPVIALTANAMSGDRDRCLAAGCTDYLTKPVDRGPLLRLAQLCLAAA